MKAVILAAGRGTRISSVTNGSPKCLLRFDNSAILDFQISALLQAGISEICLVVGFESEQIVKHVAQSYSTLWNAFTFITNPLFAETNNIYSLLLAQSWVADDGFICLNADVLCHPGIIRPASQIRTDISMVIDPAWRDETMKVIIKAGRIIRMSKAITRSEFSGTYLGVTTFSGRVVNLLFEEIEKLVLEGRVNEFYNVAVQQMISYGIQVDHTLTAGLPWAEIDDPADFHFAEACVYPLLPAPTTLQTMVPTLHAPDPVAA